MKKRHSRFVSLGLPLLAGVFAVSGCATDTGSYPSLSPRPIEKLGFGEPVVEVAVAKPDPALDTQIATLSTSLKTIIAGFDRDSARAESLARAARGAAVGSDAWLEAQTALAGLDDWRAQASSLVTDIDQRATDRAAALAAPYPALGSLHDLAQAETDRESAVISRIQASMPSA